MEENEKLETMPKSMRRYSVTYRIIGSNKMFDDFIRAKNKKQLKSILKQKGLVYFLENLEVFIKTKETRKKLRTSFPK